MVVVVILVVDDNHHYVHVPMIPKTKKYPRLGVVTGSNIRGTSLV